MTLLLLCFAAIHEDCMHDLGMFVRAEGKMESGQHPFASDSTQGKACRSYLLYQGEQPAKVIGLLLVQGADLLDEPVLRLVPLHLPSRQALPAPKLSM